MPRIATSLFAYGPGIMLCSKTRRGIPACYDCLVYHFLRVASNICTSIHHTCFYCQLIYFLAHGNKFSVYIFLTAQINMSLFTNDVSLTITPCYPSFSNVPVSGCVSVFASQNMIRLKRRTRYAARQQRLSRGTLSCRALMDMRLTALSEQHARFQAFLGGTLSLPLITQRYLAGQNTPCKYRRFESASAESHEICRMV